MKIHVGSKNLTKIQAVKDAAALYPHMFSEAEVVGVDAGHDPMGHPKTLDETVAGAIARAKAVFRSGDSDYSVGIESGLMAVPQAETGYLELTACALYDGTHIYLGSAPGFEWPKPVLDLVLRGEMDASKAFKHLGLTEHEKLGAVPGGVVGVLTRGNLTREEQMKWGVVMALLKLDNPLKI